MNKMIRKMMGAETAIVTSSLRQDLSVLNLVFAVATILHSPLVLAQRPQHADPALERPEGGDPDPQHDEHENDKQDDFPE